MKRIDSRPRKEGWTPVGPGIYEDAQGALHLSVPELLELFSVPDNAHNRRMVEEAAKDLAAEQSPGIRVEVRE